MVHSTRPLIALFPLRSIFRVSPLPKEAGRCAVNVILVYVVTQRKARTDTPSSLHLLPPEAIEYEPIQK